MGTISKKGVVFALLAACLYALNAPLSKLLLDGLSPTLLAGFLYVGAGVGILAVYLIKRATKTPSVEKSLEKRDFPYVVLMVVLDIFAPILLMFGLNITTAENTSLLNNFEIVATALIALIIFKEKISSRLSH